MRYDEIEEILGTSVVSSVERVVEQAYVASQQANDGGPEALKELMIAMLASVIHPNKDVEAAKKYIIRLHQAIDEIK